MLFIQVHDTEDSSEAFNSGVIPHVTSNQKERTEQDYISVTLVRWSGFKFTGSLKLIL